MVLQWKEGKKREADQSLSEVNKITNGTDNRFDNFHASREIVTA